MTPADLCPRVVDHLQARLRRSARRELTPAEKERLHRDGEERFLQALVLSSKYRKWAANQAARDRIAGAVAGAVAARKPIRFLHTMGGYKLWRMPTSPQSDWAEFFNIAYLLEYLSGIAAAYPPGASMTYYLYTLLPQRHDNLPAADVQAYVDSFTALVDSFRPYLPDNLSLSIVKDTDLYTPDEYYANLDEMMVLAKNRFPTFDEKWRNELLLQSRRNIKWTGAEDWSGLDDREKEDRILSGAITELAGMAMRKQGEFVRDKDNILLFVKAVSGNAFLGIGSTKSSVAKHWAGIGVLQYRKDELYDLVLSPTQWDRAEALPKVVCDVNLLELRNLQQVMVMTEPLDFSRAPE